MQKTVAGKHIAVIGYGVTGQACVEFLCTQHAHVSVYDAHDIAQQVTQVPFYKMDSDTLFTDIEIIVLSPGISPHQPQFSQFVQGGGQLISDIELFAWFNTIPVIAITGSNGKTTVTDMLGKVLSNNNKRVLLGGNYGNSALSLLAQPADYIVLELSSFQLETTYSLQAECAVILNISEDHIDRHGNLANYVAAKQRIFAHAKHIIVNREDALSVPPLAAQQNRIVASVGLDESADDFGINTASEHICFAGEALVSIADLQIQGVHNVINVQVAMAIAQQLGYSMQNVVDSVMQYQGLSHRFEEVYRDDWQLWINDSKATNVGACAAALHYFIDKDYALILIAGGDAKGADLSVLESLLSQTATQVIVFGKDAHLFTQIFDQTILVDDMHSAVTAAYQYIYQHPRQKVAVLLSPACASIDMFVNYQARGDAFKQALEEIAA